MGSAPLRRPTAHVLFAAHLAGNQGPAIAWPLRRRCPTGRSSCDTPQASTPGSSSTVNRLSPEAQCPELVQRLPVAVNQALVPRIR
jgi:hypothetical protein